ncbi:MAG: DUF255 domain-containing protein [Candidatus Hermodarchaeia archaeon]|jgi:thioredoxin-related protein
MLRFLFAILLCLSFLSGCGSQEFIEHKPTTPAKVRSIHWQPYSEASFDKSKSSEKAVLIYFTRDDDPGCKLMERATMKDPEVAHFINENFIPISVSGTHEYEVKRFPTILILSSANRTELMRLENAMSGQELLKYLGLAVRINSLTETIDNMESLDLNGFGL